MKRMLTLALLFFAVSSSAQPAAAPSPTPRSRESQTMLFQVVVLRAAVAGPEAMDDVPKNVARAIADVRDFLPFKSYRLIDSGLLRVAAGTRGTTTLDGPSKSTRYRVEFAITGFDERATINNFMVQPLTTDTNGADVHGRPVITTSFDIAPGETVVVGSSRLGGGSDALVVLLTAVPGK